MKFDVPIKRLVLPMILTSIYCLVFTEVAFTENCTEFAIKFLDQSPIDIEGVVMDNEGEPLIGVNILVKGTEKGTSTDFNGKFKLTEVEENAILIISYIGYQTKEVPVNAKTSLNITLDEDSQQLDQVVVVGYGTQKKVNLTGAVDQIDGKQFENIPVPNLSRSLQGQIPGLNIGFFSGRPTDNPSYNIRGLTSIGAGGNALILIDGVQGDPRNLNPSDIESVSVLKDAASSAIYGSRGAFGVILITTKKPSKEAQLTYSSNFSINNWTAKRELLSDNYQWAKLYIESFSNLYGGARSPTTVGRSGVPISQSILEELKYRSENPDHEKPEVEIDPATGQYLYYGSTDWSDILYKDNIMSMEHSVRASGGNELGSYAISGRYLTQDGLYKIRADNYKTYDLRVQGNLTPTKWLSISNNISFSAYDYVDPFLSSNGIFADLDLFVTSTPLAVPYNPDGTYTEASANSVGVLEMGLNEAKIQQNQIRANVAFDADIIKDILKLHGDFTYRNRLLETNQKVVPVPFSRSEGTIVDIGDSRLTNNKNTLKYFAYNLYGEYSQNFGNHELGVILGTNIEQSNTRFLNVNRSNLLVNELDVFNVVSGDNFNIVGSGSDWANLGVFSRIKYIYDEKYLLEINSRYDGSSKFPVQGQFGFFPSVSAGWRISEENFMGGTRNWLDNFKIRGSYGSLGNSQIAPYLYVEQIQASQTSKVIKGERPVVLRNPAVLPDNFTWETSTTVDLGADIDLFNYKFGLSFDWYKRTTSDMITQGPPVPAVFGASAPLGNFADLETKGFELSLRWNDQVELNKPLNYNIRVTLANDVSYITKFNNPNNLLNRDFGTFVADYYEGMKVGDIWGLTTSGLFVDEQDISNHADQSFIQHNVGDGAPRPGDIKFEDINGDGKIDWGSQTTDDPGDLTVIGNYSPQYSFGISLNGSYSNFSVAAFFQGIGRRDWYPGNANKFWGPYGYWGAAIPTHFVENSYRSENPDPNAYWPLYKGNQAYYNRQLTAQTRYLQNTAYVRLKNLSIGYSLPPNIIERLKIKGLKISFIGQNLLTFSPVYRITKDLDVEQLNIGSGSYYPMLKSYSIGVNLDL